MKIKKNNCLGFFLTLLLPLSYLAAAELRMTAPTLTELPADSRVAEGIKATPEGIVFAQGGITLSTAPWLTATQGIIDIECQMPSDWPFSDDTALFHAQSKSHVHATLFFRAGVLWAVYKGGEEFFASVSMPETGGWAAGSRHRIQFGWYPAVDDDGEVQTNDVTFTLLADGQLAGSGYGRVMSPWPARFELGSRNGSAPWRGVLRSASISSELLDLSTAVPELKAGERTITVEADQPLGNLYRFWTVANCNGPHRFLKPGYADGIKKGQPFIQQINAVYLLGGRYRDQNVWFTGVSPDGELQVDFTGMIAQLQAMLDGGFTPWIDLGNTHFAMNKEPQENTYGNTAAPDDEHIWARYVSAAIQAMIDAFGREQVSSWWFRVGCEPDLNPGHWTGTKEQYFTHYDYTISAVTKLLPEVLIGPGNILNPLSGQFGTKTQGMWGLDIIDHAGRGTNAVTGTVGTRMDWFSYSWYARVGRPLSDFDDAVNLIRTRLARYPQFRNMPLAIGEFSVLHDEKGRRVWGGDTTEWAASFYAGLADRVYQYGIRQVYEWSQTTGGVLHPRAQVIAMLDRMAEGERVNVKVLSTSAADCGAIACRKGDDLFVLLYNHRKQRRPRVPETVHLAIKDPRMQSGSEWILAQSRVDATHAAWAYAFAADCRAAGLKPLRQAGSYEGSVALLYGKPGVDVFQKNLDKYQRLAQVDEVVEPIRVGAGNFARELDMEGHSVRLIRLSPIAQ